MKRKCAAAVLTAAVAGLNWSGDMNAQTPITPPPGWLCGSTGGGSPRWTLETDASGLQALKQSGSAPFPWCVKPHQKIADGFVEVRFKALAGKDDQAGGVTWRWQNGDNYYVARANALENNVSLYYTIDGRRNTIKYVDTPVAANAWHLLRAEFKGSHIKVFLNGKLHIEADDNRISAAGLAGVWTKADSVIAFDAFQAGSATGK